MLKAVAYTRCSGLGQVEGDTWNRQLAAINKYATANGIEIVAEYRDQGVSGKLDLENREALTECINRVASNGVKLVIVETPDRLSRDAIVAEYLIRQFKKVGVEIISSDGTNLSSGDDNNPTAKLIRQILASVAEFDRCMTVLKLRAARERQRKQGIRIEGRRPFGHYESEIESLNLIKSLSQQSLNPSQIASELNSRAVKPRSGAMWYPASVSRILRRLAA